MHTPKIAVSGARGLLGQAVLAKLHARGLDVLPLSRHAMEGYVQTEGDPEHLAKLLQGVDMIINLSFDRQPHATLMGYAESMCLHQNLLEAARLLGVSRLIFASSISVYGKTNPLPWSEDHTPCPDGMYGLAKWTCEKLGAFYQRTYGLEVLNLRLAHLFGVYEKNNYMINKFMRQAHLKKTLRVNVADQSQREFLFVEDAADAVVKALMDTSYTGVVNIGSGHVYTNQEVALMINRAFKNEGHCTFDELPTPRPSHSSYMDLTLQKQQGLWNDHSMEQQLSDIAHELEKIPDVPEVF